jgi:hypothetical protein
VTFLCLKNWSTGKKTTIVFSINFNKMKDIVPCTILFTTKWIRVTSMWYTSPTFLKKELWFYSTCYIIVIYLFSLLIMLMVYWNIVNLIHLWVQCGVIEWHIKSTHSFYNKFFFFFFLILIRIRTMLWLFYVAWIFFSFVYQNNEDMIHCL